ncbi:MAG: type II toxin-antitoxin system RelE/ParE family toxin [Spirochaetales bacterium]|nr:type II toxin-antitoxin system RelE/ParE family toxin [Spirochaetales bacterium]
MKIIWSPTALARLSGIVEYIAYDSPGRAEKWAVKVLDSVKRLEDFPESGRIVPEMEIKNIREIIFGNYRIIYEIRKSHISILTIRHCKRLLDKDEILNQES